MYYISNEYPTSQIYGLSVIFRLGKSGLGGWGNRWAGAGGTKVLVDICLVFKILSKNPSR